MGSFWDGIVEYSTSDEGSLPITPNQWRNYAVGVTQAYMSGGVDGVNRYAVERTMNANGRAFDVPWTNWDEEYSIWDLAEDVDEVYDDTAERMQDIFTDIMALIGGLFATGLNMIGAPSIDDMAKPPVSLMEYDGIFMPTLRAGEKFGNFAMPDAPSVFMDLAPTFSVMADSKRLFNGLQPSTLRFGDSVEGTRQAIFRWRGNSSRSEVWA